MAIHRWYVAVNNKWVATNYKREYTTNGQDLYELAFDDTSTEYAQCTVGMPSDYDGELSQRSFMDITSRFVRRL